MASPDIVTLKNELHEAEDRFRATVEEANLKYQRLASVPAASVTADRLKVTQCSDEVALAQEKLENALKDAHAAFETFTPSALVNRFENGNLDYSVFKHSKNIERLLSAFETYPSTSRSSRDNHGITAKEISHVTAYICAGWANKPSGSPYWTNGTPPTKFSTSEWESVVNSRSRVFPPRFWAQTPLSGPRDLQVPRGRFSTNIDLDAEVTLVPNNSPVLDLASGSRARALVTCHCAGCSLILTPSTTINVGSEPDEPATRPETGITCRNNAGAAGGGEIASDLTSSSNTTDDNLMSWYTDRGATQSADGKWGWDSVGPVSRHHKLKKEEYSTKF